MDRTLRNIILFVSAVLVVVLVSFAVSCPRKVHAANPDTLIIVMPTQDNRGTCAAPSLLTTTETTILAVIMASPSSATPLATLAGAPGATVLFAPPATWPEAGAPVWTYWRDTEGNFLKDALGFPCTVVDTLRGKDSTPPARGTISRR